MPGEDDTRHMTMTIDPLPITGSVVLSRGGGHVNVWTDSEKGSARALLIGSDTHTWHLSNSSERTNFQECAPYLWAEGVALGSCALTLTLKDSSGTTAGWDSLTHTYTAAQCPDHRQPTPNENQDIHGVLPNLVDCEWVITREETSAYNCMAWSVGETEAVYNQDDIDRDFGDDDGIFEDSDVDKFYFKKQGWTPITSGTAPEKADAAEAMYYAYPSAWHYRRGDPEPEPGFHAANRSECSCGAGKWIVYQSKCGASFRIEHVWDHLNGDQYGVPDRFYH